MRQIFVRSNGIRQLDTNTRHTVLSNLVLIVAGALEQYGLDGRRFVEGLGIDYAMACDPDTRIPYELSYRLWDEAACASKDPCFGIMVAECFNPSLLHGLGFSWMASGSLQEAFARVLRFQKLINTGANFYAEDTQADTTIVADLAIPGHTHHPVYALSMLAGIVRMCRLTAGNDICPTRVTLIQEQPEQSDRIVQFFRSPVEFGANRNSISFSKSTTETPILSANPRLARINDQIVIDYLARYDQQSLVAKVQAKIIERLPSGRPNQVEVARMLNMSLRNFQRKLKQEGTSFRELVDTIRKDLAIQFIKEQDRSISAISYSLGFTEPANFTRSFKTWTGMSPKQFRQKLKR
ncbi:MAG: AraC family transcriptional regulator [bacterium]